MSKRHLYRDTRNGKIAGVCAGLADYFNLDVWLVRVLAVAAFVMGFGSVALLYLGAWLMLEPRPDDDFEQPIQVKDRPWRAGASPRQSLGLLERRYEEMEQRLRELEKFVTSEKYRLHKAFKNLKR